MIEYLEGDSGGGGEDGEEVEEDGGTGEEEVVKNDGVLIVSGVEQLSRYIPSNFNN